MHRIIALSYCAGTTLVKSLIYFLSSLLLAVVLSTKALAQTPVTVVEVDNKGFTNSLQLNANLSAFSEVDLASEVTAIVKELLFESGDQVTEGQLLLKLDDTEQALLLQQSRAVLERLEAEVTLAELDKKRFSKLLKSKSVSQEQYDRAIAKTHQAVADVKAQKAAIKLAENTLDKFSIRAPFDGVITKRLIEKGTLLRPGELVAQLTATHPLKVELGVPQRYFGSIKTGARLSLSSPNTPNNIAPTVITVDKLVDRANENRLFTVWGRLDNQSRNWLPGMSVKATVSWQNDSSQNLIVPSDAIQQQANGKVSLWKIVDGDSNDEKIVEAVAINILSREGLLANVLPVDPNELLAGDLVVVGGNESLQAKQTVKINKVANSNSTAQHQGN